MQASNKSTYHSAWKKKQKCRRNKSSALELCLFSFRFHLLSWWRSQEVDWSVNYNLDLMFCLRAHAGRQRVTINQLLTASSGSGWGLWWSWSQSCVKDNDDLRAADDETVSLSHYSVFGYIQDISWQIRCSCETSRLVYCFGWWIWHSFCALLFPSICLANRPAFCFSFSEWFSCPCIREDTKQTRLGMDEHSLFLRFFGDFVYILCLWKIV